jgi:hypothetical protein
MQSFMWPFWTEFLFIFQKTRGRASPKAHHTLHADLSARFAAANFFP